MHKSITQGGRVWSEFLIHDTLTINKFLFKPFPTRPDNSLAGNASSALIDQHVWQECILVMQPMYAYERLRHLYG